MKQSILLIFFMQFLLPKVNATPMLCIGKSPVLVFQKKADHRNFESASKYISLKHRLQKHLNLEEKKPLHVLAQAGFLFALMTILGAIAAPLLVWSTGYLTFEFGYLTVQIAILGILLCLRSLSDMQKEPDRWAGKRRAKWGLFIGTFVSLWIAAWFAAVVLKGWF